MLINIVPAVSIFLHQKSCIFHFCPVNFFWDVEVYIIFVFYQKKKKKELPKILVQHGMNTALKKMTMNSSWTWSDKQVLFQWFPVDIYDRLFFFLYV